MKTVERWLENELNLFLLASIVFFVIGMGYVYVFTLHKDMLDVVLFTGCFDASCMFLVFRRSIEGKMTNVFAHEQWFKTAQRYSRIAWVLCGGVLFSYVGFLNIATQPWHVLLGISAALFVAGAVILVFLSEKNRKLSEKEIEKKNSGEKT